ncbi:hypothetical protein O9361_02590 [Proteus vulgaris]|uniref:hypothetical protein n=1 Tax=Proteus vulgaris TaxID=585 RepID=UPI002575B6EB|nr:hypothetical protein [Proteus vulgaris]MDM3562514.1 hypothetical protein [Proteus vulgaris]
MNELEEIYESLKKQYEEQKELTLQAINSCSWISSKRKKYAPELISGKAWEVQKMIEQNGGYFFLNKKRYRFSDSDVMKYNHMKTEQIIFMFTGTAHGLNHYIHHHCWLIGVYSKCAEGFWPESKKIAIDALVTAIRFLSEFNVIRKYRYLVKMERGARTKRGESSIKGGNSVAELAALFRGEAIRLLEKNMPEAIGWKNRQEAVKAIEVELWQFIEIKSQEGYNTQLKQETLNGAVIRWAAKHDDIKKTFDYVVKKRIAKNKK